MTALARSPRLGSGDEARFLELLQLAGERPDPPAFLESAAAQWDGRRLGSTLVEAASALREGRALDEALEGRLAPSLRAVLSTRAGDGAGNAERAVEAKDRESAAWQLVWAPSLHPALLLSASGLALALLGAWAFAPIQALRVELALLAERPAPGGWLAFAAAQPAWIVVAGFAMAMAPWALPALLHRLGQSAAGSRAAARWPLLSAVGRWRASADFASALSEAIRSGHPHEEAWRTAASGVGPRAWRERLLAASGRAAGGEALDELWRSVGLPSTLAPRLRPNQVATDGGVEALAAVASLADREHREALRRAGRALFLGTSVAAALSLLSLVASVLLPLFNAGLLA